MLRVISVGDTCIDIYDDGRWYPTGNCVDFAVNLAYLGNESYIFSVVGDDLYGEKICELLDSCKINKTIKRISGNTSVSHIKLVGETGKDRLHVSYDEGVMKHFSINAEELDFIGSFDIIHTHHYGNTDPYLKEFKNQGKTIIYDYSTHWSDVYLKETARFVDYGFFSYDKDDEYIRDHLKRMSGQGMKAAIATLGDNGSILYDGNSYISCGIIKPKQLINTVGAGDSYIAGFVHGLLHSNSLRECMECGALLSSKVVECFTPYIMEEFCIG